MINSRFFLYISFWQFICSFFFLLIPFSSKVNKDKLLIERELINRTGKKHALVINEARLGIYLVIKTLIKTSSNRKVLLSPYTLYDVVNMVITAGATPVFIDTPKNKLALSAQSLEGKLDSSVLALIYTHYHEIDEGIVAISKICKTKNITLIEDAAISFGGKYNEQLAGTFGDIGVYSFGMLKNVSAILGGSLVLNDDSLAEKINKEIEAYPTLEKKRILSAIAYGLLIKLITHPFIHTIFTFWIFRFAYLNDVNKIIYLLRPDKNMHLLNNIPNSYTRNISKYQCKLILEQFKNVETDNKARIKNAIFYENELKSITGIIIPAREIREGDPYLEFPILAENRDKLFKTLIREGFDCRKFYYRNCANIDIFKEYYKDCPNAQSLEDRIIMLPIYPSYSQNDIIKISYILKNN